MNNKGKKKVLCLGDIHAPFSHKDSIPFLKWVIKKYGPFDETILTGDEADFHSLSDYDQDPDGMSAGDELKKTIEHLEPFYDLFPKAKVCTSNHTSRPFRQAYKHGIPAVFIKDYRDFLHAPISWQWADYWEVDGVRYEHGEGFLGQLGAYRTAVANMCSTVIGHIHSHAGIQYLANEKHLIYGFNVGCLIDRHAYAFAYGKKIKAKPCIGVGIVDKGVPTWVPMLLNSNGRWVKNG